MAAIKMIGVCQNFDAFFLNRDPQQGTNSYAGFKLNGSITGLLCLLYGTTGIQRRLF